MIGEQARQRTAVAALDDDGEVVERAAIIEAEGASRDAAERQAVALALRRRRS